MTIQGAEYARRAAARARVGERPRAGGGRGMISRYAPQLAVTGGSTAELDVGEERVRPRFRGSTHKYAFFASLITGAVLVIVAPTDKAGLAAAIYALSVSALFGTSALYHRITWKPAARRWMRRLDHSMIFVLIAGTYTPLTLLILHGTLVARGAGCGVGWRDDRRRAEAGLDRRPEVADLGRLPGARLGGRGHDPADALARRRGRRGAGRDRRPPLHGRRGDLRRCAGPTRAPRSSATTRSSTCS